jgi:hypothetical protein
MHQMDFDAQLTLNTELLDIWHQPVVNKSLELLMQTHPAIGLTAELEAGFKCIISELRLTPQSIERKRRVQCHTLRSVRKT